MSGIFPKSSSQWITHSKISHSDRTRFVQNSSWNQSRRSKASSGGFHLAEVKESIVSNLPAITDLAPLTHACVFPDSAFFFLFLSLFINDKRRVSSYCFIHAPPSAMIFLPRGTQHLHCNLKSFSIHVQAGKTSSRERTERKVQLFSLSLSLSLSRHCR